MGLDKKDRVIGTRVQDYFARLGTVRWVGKLTIGKSTNTYIGVEFNEPNELPARSDGTFEGERYFEAPRGTAQFLRPELLDVDKITESAIDVRKALGEHARDMSNVEIQKFCIARKYELKPILAMIEKNIKWRETTKPTELVYLPPSMAEDYPVGFQDGVDYEGNLIYVERPGNGGKCTAEQFLERYGLQTIARWHLASMERGRRLMQESNYRSVRTTVIVDLSNLAKTFGALMKYAKLIASLDQDNYPENLARVFVVNAPGFFSTVWSMVRPFLDPRTREKAFVLEPGKALEAMKPYLPLNMIPSFAGGSNDSWLARGGMAGCSEAEATAQELPQMALDVGDSKEASPTE